MTVKIWRLHFSLGKNSIPGGEQRTWPTHSWVCTRFLILTSRGIGQVQASRSATRPSMKASERKREERRGSATEFGHTHNQLAMISVWGRRGGNQRPEISTILLVATPAKFNPCGVRWCWLYFLRIFKKERKISLGEKPDGGKKCRTTFGFARKKSRNIHISMAWQKK